MQASKVSQESLDLIFNNARSANDFLDTPVPADLLKQVYDLAKMGATAFNCQPTRYVFVTSVAAKDRLIPCLGPTNQEKSRACPVNVIVATDNQFFDKLPTVFPNYPAARDLFVNNAAMAQATGARNGTLGAAYFMMAARALGLDCGPMSGFDAAKVNAEFFADGKFSANFVINLGYSSGQKIFPRNPRLSFDEACQVI